MNFWAVIIRFCFGKPSPREKKKDLEITNEDGKNIEIEKFTTRFINPQNAYERDVNNGVDVNTKVREIYEKNHKDRTFEEKEYSDNEWIYRRYFNRLRNYYKFDENNGVGKLNNREEFKFTFKQYKARYKNTTSLSNGPLSKPLCIYAVDGAEDHNGSVVSSKALKISMDDIKFYEKNYTVIPFIIDNKETLDEKIAKYKEKLSINDVSLVYFSGHGSPNSVLNFTLDSSAKLSTISSNTQILLRSCSAMQGGQGIGYKIAKDNNCEVFGADNTFVYIKTILKKENGKTKVDHVEYFSYGPVPSWRVKVQSERVQQNSHQQIQ